MMTGVGCARPDSPGIYARTKAAYPWIQEQICAMSQVPPPDCQELLLEDNDNNDISREPETLTLEEIAGSNATPSLEQQQPPPEPELPSPETTTTLALRVDVHYDNFPQEISWALARHDNPSSLKDHPDQLFTLLHQSPRQSIAVQNQRVSQEIRGITAGRYRLEVYDTIAGDGIRPSSTNITTTDEEDAAIQLWQLTVTTTTSFHWSVTANATVPTIEDTHMESQLLWSHPGNFGEFVRSNVEVGL